MKASRFFLGLALSGALGIVLVSPSSAQTSSVKPVTPLAATAPTAVPALVPFSGTALAVDGKPLTGDASITFVIYKDEQGGEPLFIESQTLSLDAGGRYKAELGATLPSGIPLELFTGGEARWLEVQIAGQPAQPRTLLASVPYALKAGDASTLGGLPASAYALAGSKTAAANASTNSVSPNLTSNVTTTGGTSGYVPEFTGAASIADSPIFVNGANVGVGTAIPTATLDVNGAGLFTGGLTVNGVSTLNGFLLLPALGTATTGTSYNSQYFKLVTSAYNSSTNTIVAPRFQLQAEVKGNNTANPIGTLNLIASNGPASPTETGFSIQSNGIVNFAPGQTFPGTAAGTITGVAAGTALTGGGTSGNVALNLDTTKVPLLAANNAFAGNQSVAGSLTATGGLSTGGQIVSTVPTGTAPLAVASSTMVPNLNASLLGGLPPGAFVSPAASNTFTATQSFSKVGIGTTAPRSLLELSSTAFAALGSVLTLTNTAGGAAAENALDFNTIAPSATGTYNPMARIAAVDALHFSDNILFQSNISGAANSGLQTNMIILSNGNVGIGTTSPTSALQVNGAITANSASFSGPVTFAPGQTFPGATITGVTAGTALTGGGTSGNVTLNLDTTKVPLLAASNSFSGNQSVTGALTATGNLAAGGQLVSSVATGTAPLSVNSTTQVQNLNASFLGGFPASAFAATTGSGSNTFVGYQALASNTTGYDNTASGYQAIASNTFGSDNTASGYQALYSNTTGSGNAAIGAYTLSYNTTGFGNTASGSLALESNTSGYNNTANGNFALSSNTTGSENAAIGTYTLFYNTTGSGNTASGNFALETNTTGYENTASGASALFNNTSGIWNTASGSSALYTNTSGYRNIGIGAEAGNTSDYSGGTGSYNTAVGSNSAFGTGSIHNATAIGAFAEVDNNNTLILGCTAGNAEGCPTTTLVGIGTTTPDNLLTVNGSADKPGGGSWNTYSDGRLKTVNGSFGSGLDQVLKLRPIRYRYNPDNALGIRDGDEHIGVVAQEVQRVIPEAVTENAKGYLLVNNDPILWSMVNAIKEQQQAIREQQKEIDQLRGLLRGQNAAARSHRARSAKQTRRGVRVVKQAAATQPILLASR